MVNGSLPTEHKALLPSPPDLPCRLGTCSPWRRRPFSPSANRTLSEALSVKADAFIIASATASTDAHRAVEEEDLGDMMTMTMMTTTTTTKLPS